MHPISIKFHLTQELQYMFLGPRDRVYCVLKTHNSPTIKKEWGKDYKNWTTRKGSESWFQVQSYWCCGKLQPQSLVNYSYTEEFLQLFLLFSWQVRIPWTRDTQHHQYLLPRDLLLQQTSPLTVLWLQWCYAWEKNHPLYALFASQTKLAKR